MISVLNLYRKIVRRHNREARIHPWEEAPPRQATGGLERGIAGTDPRALSPATLPAVGRRPQTPDRRAGGFPAPGKMRPIRGPIVSPWTMIENTTMTYVMTTIAGRAAPPPLPVPRLLSRRLLPRVRRHHPPQRGECAPESADAVAKESFQDRGSSTTVRYRPRSIAPKARPCALAGNRIQARTVARPGQPAPVTPRRRGQRRRSGLGLQGLRLVGEADGSEQHRLEGAHRLGEDQRRHRLASLVLDALLELGDLLGVL